MQCTRGSCQERHTHVDQKNVDRSLEVLGTADGGSTTCGDVGRRLAVMLRTFEGRPGDLANALTEFCLATNDAPRSLLEAQDAATWMVRQPCPATRDAGIQLLVWLVGRGCAWAKYNLAVELTLGASIPSDFVRANALLQQAISGAVGDAGLIGMACGALAENYAAGRGEPANRKAAQYWYERAAEFGNAPAAFNAALFYDQPAAAGEGGPPRDTLRATYFYELAAQRLPVAKVKLAFLHLSQAFAGAEAAVGRRLLEEAAAEGHAGALHALHSLFGDARHIPAHAGLRDQR